MPSKKIKNILMACAICLIVGYCSLSLWFDSDPHKSTLIGYVKAHPQVLASAGAIKDVSIIGILNYRGSAKEAAYRDYTLHVKGAKDTLRVIVRIDPNTDPSNEMEFKLISIEIY